MNLRGTHRVSGPERPELPCCPLIARAPRGRGASISMSRTRKWGGPGADTVTVTAVGYAVGHSISGTRQFALYPIARKRKGGSSYVTLVAQYSIVATDSLEITI